MSVLRQKHEISREEQERYYATEIWPSMQIQEPRQVLFSYLHYDRLIGYGGLVHIDWCARKGEVSVLLDCSESSHCSYRKTLSMYLLLLKQAAFSGLRLHRIWTECYDIRPQHISIFEENGFQFEGRLKDHEWIDNRYVDTLFHGCIADSLHTRSE